jgi:Holliday junction resolvase RusA-like endonuclease
LSGFLRPTSRPDTDNYIKSVQDALNGIVWKDDSQVVALIADKWYSDKPRIEIDVREVEE